MPEGPHHDAFDPPVDPSSPSPMSSSPSPPNVIRQPRSATRPDAEGSGSLDLRNSWQVIAGSILIPLGVIFVLIAWYGSAHARVVQQQIPYLVSGSFIGLGCMVIGGLCYWGHWLYRRYDQAELHHDEQLRALEELTRAVTELSSMSAGGGAPAVGRPSGQDRIGSYLATANGSVYHQAECPVIAHHPNDLRVLGPTDLAGLRPCQICSPA